VGATPDGLLRPISMSALAVDWIRLMKRCEPMMMSCVANSRASSKARTLE
jgi:hypothetical protein